MQRLIRFSLLLFAWSTSGTLCAQQSGSPQLAGVTCKTPYPLRAKAAGIEGAVTVKTVISKDGIPGQVHAIKGPPELLDAGENVVRCWKYHPYLDHGVPVEVNTTVTINFNMGKGGKKKEEMEEAQAELDASQQKPGQKAAPVESKSKDDSIVKEPQR